MCSQRGAPVNSVHFYQILPPQKRNSWPLAVKPFFSHTWPWSQASINLLSVPTVLLILDISQG